MVDTDIILRPSLIRVVGGRTILSLLLLLFHVVTIGMIMDVSVQSYTIPSIITTTTNNNFRRRSSSGSIGAIHSTMVMLDIITTNDDPQQRRVYYFRRRSLLKNRNDNRFRMNSRMTNGSSDSSNDNNNQCTTTTTTTTTSDIGVGIDLGTTNSAVAYLKDGCIPTIISIPHNGRTIPSIVALQQQQQSSSSSDLHHIQQYTSVVGKLALLLHDANTNSNSSNVFMMYRNVKRIIGTGGKVLLSSSSSSSSSYTSRDDVSFIVPHVYISKTGKTYTKYNLLNQLYDSIHHPTLLLLRRPYQQQQQQPLTSSGNPHDTDTIMDSVQNDFNHSHYIRPEVISSYILQFLKHITEIQLNVTVSRAVIGVPAYFNDAQRNATIHAAQLAGISKVKLLREPEAAALAYGYRPIIQKDVVIPSTATSNNNNNQENDDELVLVFDLGGGTYDVSILYTSRKDQIMEIIATSGNTELGGSTFDTKIALYLQQQIRMYTRNIMEKKVSYEEHNKKTIKNVPNSIVVLAAEAIRIYLSNHRIVNLLLPINEDDWYTTIANQPSSVIVTSYTSSDTSSPMVSNSTHLYMTLTRKEMETICIDEIQALLRPIREVAIMANALLPGDSSPSMVAAAALMTDDEVDDDDDNFGYMFQQPEPSKTTTTTMLEDFYSDDDDMTGDNAEMLRAMASSKKSQQLGRKRARDVAKEERKYRQEKKNIAVSSPLGSGTNKNRITSSSSTSSPSNTKNPKVRDGISGRPISRIVLVGGATRMPCIGRLLTVVTGIVPQRTVNPDEAVALGCAVQVGIYDGQRNMGTVLNPMQAAILRATMASGMTSFDNNGDDDDDDDFDDGIVY